jgi:hypothetical protein
MMSLLARLTFVAAARALVWVLVEVAIPLLVPLCVLGFRLAVAVRGRRPEDRQPRRLTSSVSVCSGRRPLASRA